MRNQVARSWRDRRIQKQQGSAKPAEIETTSRETYTNNSPANIIRDLNVITKVSAARSCATAAAGLFGYEVETCSLPFLLVPQSGLDMADGEDQPCVV